MMQDLISEHGWQHSQREVVTGLRQTLRPSALVGIVNRLLPPPLLVFLAMLSVQFGAAFAKDLFPVIGAPGAVFLRLTFAAIILLLVWRPRLLGYTRKEYILIVLFGLTIASMNGFYYASLVRLPLGIATTLEFVGPLGVSLVSSRRLPDILWTLFAAAGVILLAPIKGANIDPLGVLLALSAGGCWAAYILLNVRVGQTFAGGTGLALGMAVAAIAFAPFGLPSIGAAWHNPSIFLIGLGVAILSTVIPFSLELEALRRVSARAMGILLSMEPVLGALVGLILLGETVALRAIIAMVLIVIASGGVSLSGKRNKR
jgi:inner membrane transporter RhtA